MKEAEINKREITRDDIMSLDDYERVRGERRKAMTERKRNRRVLVGPDVTFYFENFDTMWHQIHEMLRIEKGGEEQIEDELRAYSPLIPNGRDLVATMMIEIDDERRRDRVLRSLGGIEKCVSLEVGGDPISAVPEADVERTTDAGKTSSVHFFKFPFSDDQIQRFRSGESRVVLGVHHRNYDHMAALSEAVRAELAGDFD